MAEFSVEIHSDRDTYESLQLKNRNTTALLVTKLMFLGYIENQFFLSSKYKNVFLSMEGLHKNVAVNRNVENTGTPL